MSLTIRRKNVKSEVFRQSAMCTKTQIRQQRAYQITQACLNRGLYFREHRRLAVISGAGIAGLAAAFELRARNFKVIVAEMRTKFSRFNVINLNIETQVFLKRFGLLEKFELSVAARIKEHRYVLIGKNGFHRFNLEDVRRLKLDESISFEPNNFKNLFTKDGIYSVSIEDLQTFLAENAARAGVQILGDVGIKVLKGPDATGVSRVEVRGKESMNSFALEPHLFFIAEGARSTTLLQLGMKTKVVQNECSGENWIFGNLSYKGKKSFVVSLLDATKPIERIANVIFNAKAGVINVAVLSNRKLTIEQIKDKIEEVAKTAIFVEKVNTKEPPVIGKTVTQPVTIINRIAIDFSIGNFYRIGDAAGHSSPLAGVGGTIGLTLVPRAVKNLLDDLEVNLREMHSNFKTFSEGSVNRWIDKSVSIKGICLKILESNQDQNLGKK